MVNPQGRLARMLRATGRLAVMSFKVVLAAVLVLAVAAFLDGFARDFLDIELPFSALVGPYHAPRRASPAVRSDLRNLVTANESFFVDHGYYGTYDEVTAARLFAPSTGVTITSTDGGPDGCSATGTHAAWTDGRCTLYVGTARPSFDVPKGQNEGDVACTPEGENRRGKALIGLAWLLSAVASTIVLDARRKAGIGFTIGMLLGPMGLVLAILIRRAASPVAAR